MAAFGFVVGQVAAYLLAVSLLIGHDPHRYHSRRVWAVAAYLGLLAGGSVGGIASFFHAGTVANNLPSYQVESARQDILDAITDFRKGTGVLPARLDDLTSKGPITGGLDTSGNAVPLPQTTFAKPFLRKLPVDPLSGRRDTWIYEPTGDLVVESSAWQSTTLSTGQIATTPPPRGR